LEALGINGSFLLVQIVNLIIVYVVVAKWIVGPIMGMLEKRRETINSGLEDARVAAEARANAEKEAQKIIADAQSKASQVVREATERAEVEAARARDKAVAEVEEDRNRILGDLRGQVAALSIAATQKLVGQALDEKRQHALINEFFSGVQSGKIVIMEDAQLSGAAAEITSALPLTKEEQEIVKSDVLAKTGAQAVAFRVDPAILGGLVIKVGDKVLDGSVSGKLEGLRSSLR
jgi:F-type H+-transporting ATPase subunit b